MAQSGGPVRCPRGHLTAEGYQFCTTCGERVVPEPVAQATDVPPPFGEGAGDEGIGFALPPDLDVPSAADAPSGASKRGRLRGGIGRLRRKTAPSDAPAGPSLLTDADAPDLEPVEYAPPPIEPPEIAPPPIEPPPAAVPLGSSVYDDVEFAIGPGARSRLSYGRSDPVGTPAAPPSGKRGPAGLPTRALVAVLLVIAAIAAAIIVFLTRGPSTPAVVPPTSIPTVPSTTTSPAPVPTAAALSEECGNSFAFAAAHAAEARAPTLQERTVRLCTTTAEWLAGARLHPTAIGLTDASEVGEDDLARICAGALGAALCRTAATPSPATPPAASSASPTAVESPASPSAGSLLPSP